MSIATAATRAFESIARLEVSRIKFHSRIAETAFYLNYRRNSARVFLILCLLTGLGFVLFGVLAHRPTVANDDFYSVQIARSCIASLLILSALLLWGRTRWLLRHYDTVVTALFVISVIVVHFIVIRISPSINPSRYVVGGQFVFMLMLTYCLSRLRLRAACAVAAVISAAYASVAIATRQQGSTTLYPLLAQIALVNTVGFCIAYMSEARERMLFRSARLLRRQQASLRRHAASAEEVAEAKSRFVTVASHDLRQPLYALGILAGTLEAISLDKRQRLIVDKIRSSTANLQDFLDGLLDMARFDACAVTADSRSFRIDALAGRLVEEYRPLADERRLELGISAVAGIAHSDPALIERVLRNLLSNSIRYTHEGAVTIRITQRGECLIVSVCDTGIGIAPEARERIFDEFYQIDNRSAVRGRGIGLGLAIVRRIDRLLDLDLQLRSDLGVGSEFSFSLPLAIERPDGQGLAGAARVADNSPALDDCSALPPSGSNLVRSRG